MSNKRHKTSNKKKTNSVSHDIKEGVKLSQKSRYVQTVSSNMKSDSCPSLKQSKATNRAVKHASIWRIVMTARMYTLRCGNFAMP